MEKKQRSWRIELALLVIWTALTAFFFANVEIQIEGPAGWASSLPTWRVEKHWLLDLFWGGRPMTGYHAWVFSFMFLVFHLGVFIDLTWSFRTEARIIASLMLFWIIEDFLWFVLNPAFGIHNFSPHKVPWHKQWFLHMPLDYWTLTVVSALLLWWSFAKPRTERYL
ncbi:MAG: hypothetical protein A2X58_12475 [Nitrospirae bacterium GWC2_56_14]|nr:MAG: hypothetical protein A2X58_12475 [Nitrospirae bacterium GWC2_56_14]